MHKRGQITIFLVVGVLLLASIAAFLYIRSSLQTQELKAEDGRLPLATSLKGRITAFVESCLQQTAEPGIYVLGIQGGVLFPDDPTKVLVTENILLNYGYLNGVHQLSVEAMEQQLDHYVEENLEFCLKDFTIFAEQGIIVEEKSSPSSAVAIKRNEVRLTLEYSLDIIKEGDALHLDSFSTVVPLRVGHLVETAERIIEEHEQNPAALDLPSLTAFDAFVSAFPFDEATTIYSLNDPHSVLDGTPFTFMFAIRDYTINSAPQLDYIPDVVIQLGEQLVLDITADDAENDPLTFSSDSAQFPISEGGTIEATPTTTGSYDITITVEDDSGLNDEQQFRIIVVE